MFMRARTCTLAHTHRGGIEKFSKSKTNKHKILQSSKYFKRNLTLHPPRDSSLPPSPSSPKRCGRASNPRVRPGHKSVLIPTPILGAADMGALLNLHLYGIILERVFIASSREFSSIRSPFWLRCRWLLGCTNVFASFIITLWNTKRGGVS